MSKTCVVEEECHTKMPSEKNSTSRKTNSVYQPSTVWPVLSKSFTSSKYSSPEKHVPTAQPNLLLRSGSLDRIRQFPAYLCRRGSNSVLFWIYQSRSTFREVLSSAHEQLRGLFLTLCVYLVIGLIAVQFIMCLLVVSIAAKSIPSGLIFLITCLASISLIGLKTMRHSKEIAAQKHHHS